MKAIRRKTLLPALAGSLCALAASISDASASTGACEREILSAAAKYDIPPGILYSVGLAETGRKGSLQPFALNIEGKAYFGRNREEALQAFEAARARGAKLIDLGCMQINHYFHGEHFASFLARLHARHETWTMAVARYHAGPNNDPAQKQYVCRVIANLVATGYGSWTPNAKQFCR